MNILIYINITLLSVSVIGILLVFFFNPLLFLIEYLFKKKRVFEKPIDYPFISFLTIIHNGEAIIKGKVNNILDIDYPSDKYEIIIFSDGSNDTTNDCVNEFTDSRVTLISSPSHEGKNLSINKASKCCKGDIIIFSDADSIIEPNAVLDLIKYFKDPDVGGVCGNIVIQKKDNNKDLKEGQSSYISFDSLIKKLESKAGCISSNSGKLYAVRQKLFPHIPSSVTDDLFVCLHVVKNKSQFLFAHEVKVYIKTPSRDSAHELNRRRRVTTRSLTGLVLMKELLNPFKYGMFSVHLFINKIVRRLMPVCLIFILISTVSLSFCNKYTKLFLYGQLGFYCLALFYIIIFLNPQTSKLLRKITSTAYYFCIGNYGVFLGLIDFLNKKKFVKWEPLKSDNKKL